MIRKLAFAALALAGAAPAAAQDLTPPEDFVAALYAPYAEADPDWAALDQVPIYAEETAELIGTWEDRLPPDEVTDLADFDWLCECQDWDSESFEVQVIPDDGWEDETAEVTARFDLGWGDQREVRFLLIDEGGEWRVFDQFSDSFPYGLRSALQYAIDHPEP